MRLASLSLASCVIACAAFDPPIENQNWQFPSRGAGCDLTIVHPERLQAGESAIPAGSERLGEILIDATAEGLWSDGNRKRVTNAACRIGGTHVWGEQTTHTSSAAIVSVYKYEIWGTPPADFKDNPAKYKPHPR